MLQRVNILMNSVILTVSGRCVGLRPKGVDCRAMHSVPIWWVGGQTQWAPMGTKCRALVHRQMSEFPSTINNRCTLGLCMLDDSGRIPTWQATFTFGLWSKFDLDGYHFSIRKGSGHNIIQIHNSLIVFAFSMNVWNILYNFVSPTQQCVWI